MNKLARLVPARSLPTYAHAPGLSPHPVSDPLGHSYGQPPEQPSALLPDRWHDSETYLWGIDLFNHGYYWEAHEAWEALWHAHHRTGPIADFLKGLIQLAVAGVKILQDKPAAIDKHVRRAGELFDQVASRVDAPSCLGIEFRQLTQVVGSIAQNCNPAAIVVDLPFG